MIVSWDWVPVVPCGRRVVISGILAGGTPGFRNVGRTFCTLPGRLAFVIFLFSLLLRYMQGSSSTHKLLNSHRADLSMGDNVGSLLFWFFVFFVFGFGFAGFGVLGFVCFGGFLFVWSPSHVDNVGTV